MNDTQITSTVTKELNWARHHFLVIAASLVLAGASVYGLESLIAKRTHEAFIEQKTFLEQLTTQNKQQIDALTQQNTTLQNEITTIIASINARDAQLDSDRKKIKDLPPDQLATKWGAAANQPAPAISPTGDFLAPLPLAQASVDALIQVPVLTKDKADLQSSLKDETQVADNEKKQHTLDNETCAATIKTKDAQISDIKAQARKREAKIAAVFTVVGLVARKLIGF
jgi:hypothetical protein